jgi:two-component system, cell cycle sensor histidine kinase and response regulator CckA
MKPDVFFVLDSAGWPALLVDAAGAIVRANQEAIKVLGSVAEGERPLLSAIWVDGFGPTAEQFLPQWERSPSDRVSLKFRVKGGSTATFSVAICSFIKDGQKFFILQLLPETKPVSSGTEFVSAHKQKLDCALQLARTVSLDFNNALTSILGHTSLLLGQTPPNHPWRASLLEVEKSATRAGEIANDLGLFSRQEKEPRAQTAGNLNSLAQRSVESLQNSRPEKIEWNLQLGRHLYAPKFDEAKMQQALLKVLENAADAVGAGGNGRVTVQTRNVELAEAAQDRDLRLAPGTYVCAEISDNGCGIAPENLARIFEPFFTTKKGGKHRGLGLALVYGIVTNHGGGVAVSSQPEAGTSVRIYLPAEKKIARERVVNPNELNGTQTLLMVDDEDAMLTMGQIVLSSFGYRVLTANNGQKAMEMLAQDGSSIDLVITDLVMPSMSGRDLVEHIRRVAPQTRVLCMSGFVRGPNQENETSYLQKPFSTQDLLIKVKQALSVAE